VLEASLAAVLAVELVDEVVVVESVDDVDATLVILLLRSVRSQSKARIGK
jgi:hypothetical protein